MLGVVHKRCEAHKYIRVGGGFRHSYSYLKSVFEELQAELERDGINLGRLAAIHEASVKAVKTYIRTKSGNLIERIVFMTEEDYNKFIEGGANAEEMLRKYLSKDEADNLESWDKEEVKAIKTYIRTKSGRLKEQLVYVSKSDYDKIKSGEMDASAVNQILNKYVKTKDGEKLDGWGEAEMKLVKTMVRTKSGRLVEKTIMVSKEEYEELQRIAREGGDPSSVLKKYMSKDEKVESWKKVEAPPKPMKVVKTMVRTKSGRLIEKTVMMTEEEYEQFQASGGDKNFLKKFMGLKDGEEIEQWEKASTVYGADSDDEQVKNAKVGQRIVGDDGVVYEIYVDPKTGKKFKKKLGQVEDFENLKDVLAGGKVKYKKGKGPKGKKKGKGGDSDDDLPTTEQIKKYKAMKEGKRNKDSDSEFSYRSVVSAGGTRKVMRRRKRKDGTYSAEHSYHSEEDEEGKARRRRRRRERKHGADSAHSYYSVVSAGGTRRVRRRKRNADGTYGTDEEYHSDESIAMRRAIKKKKKKDKHGSDSEYSYFSEVSAGGTRRKKKMKRIRDADGKVIGHGKAELHYSSDDSDSSYESYYDADGVKRYKKKPPKVKYGKAGGKKGKLGKSRKDFDGGFSDQSTDTEDEPDLEAMTEEERKEYLAKKAIRRAERERKRREKYGDKYDEIMAQHEKNKKQLRKERALAEGLGWDSDEYDKDPEAFKEKYKSMVTYDKGGERFKKGKEDTRGHGLGHDSWGDGKKGKGKTVRVKDGHEADSEGEDDGPGGRGGRRKKKGGKDGTYAGDDSETESFIGADGKKKKRSKKGGDEIIESDFEYEYEYDEMGRIKRKKKKYHDGESGSEYEFEYDQFGNLLGKKKIKEGKESRKHRIFKDDGNYFEKGADGKLRLRPGRNKIDIDKLTADDLRALGIDPNMSKQDIARALKAKFGDSIEITKGGQRVGLKNLADYGSDADTDDLANDSDLDTSTLKPGRRRVQILMKKGGPKLLEYMKKIIDDSLLVDRMEPERDASIDYIQAYRLVDQRKIDAYAKAFVVEDENKTGVLKYEDFVVALEGIPSINSITKKQVQYVMKVLNLDHHSDVSFRMFGVSVALCERVTKMDAYCKELLEISNLADIERKMELYRSMFQCNASGDRDPNFIKCESLMIELMAGGLSWQQQEYVISQLEPNEWKEISFIDYLVYIPLFLSMHDGICDNPLDMSLNKYGPERRLVEQRDMNPLGFSLKKQTAFALRQQADELLSGKKPDVEQAKKDNSEVINRYSKLPSIIGSVEKRPAGATRFM
ncbi:myosin-2 heavy chain-like [Watersipora subatra]|uniref:myosin-2 heavy chain-like n=1 Tax=Watersipora subatra TaxID=2589382 RepID=UPI00355C6984